MKKKLIAATATLAVLVLGTAMASNPSPDKHRMAIKRQVALRNRLADLPEYHSVGVASYTLVNGEVVSIGAFRMVALVASTPE